jgi:protein gp37
MTAIEWTDRTWNPIRGCSRVSDGCRHCYAEAIAARFSLPGNSFHGFAERTADGPRWTGAVTLLPDRLAEPLSWRKPARVFVNSMSDLFHENLPDEAIDQVFAVMALTPQHTYQVLTKRADRMLAYMVDDPRRCGRIADAVQPMRTDERAVRPLPHLDGGERWWPLPNVWLGVSVEDQHFADERIPLLLQTPAAVRFISAEPLLGPVDLSRWTGARVSGDPLNGLEFCPRCGSGPRQKADTVDCPDCGREWSGPRLLDFIDEQKATHLDWVIVGGESGPGARPFDIAWGRSIVQQCQAAGIACFVKQLGAKPFVADPDRDWSVGAPDGTFGIRDKKGGDPAEWPGDLRVREFPAVRL